MNNPTPKKPHIVFYFSDTGGGHRSAAEAIIEAINIEYRDQVTTEMVDFFKDYAPLPFNYAGEMYPYMVKAPKLWSARTLLPSQVEPQSATFAMTSAMPSVGVPLPRRQRSEYSRSSAP